MFKHLLVPLDGSSLAESALPVAAFLAEKIAAKVTLLHVVEKDAPHEVHGQHHLRSPGEAIAYLNKVSERWFPKGVGVDCHVHTAETTNVAESINAHRNELGHDLIVMCTHGRGRALHLILGSMAQKIITMGPVPVLITHPEEKGERRGFSCGSILVPLDTDPAHAQAMPVAKELARACGATLHLAMVVPSFGTLSGKMVAPSRLLPGTTSKMLDMQVQNAEEYLQAQGESLRGQGVEARPYVLRGDPAEVIVDFARQLAADFIVLATHGKSGLEAFWEGSVAHRICSRSSIPLLLIPVEKS
jgi:nucleotide-binding universal stress UspA family protein